MSPRAIYSAYLRLPFNLFLREAIKRTWNTVVLIVLRYVLRRKTAARAVRDFQLMLDLNDPGICRQLLIRADREPEHSFIISLEMRPGMTFLDIGANIGFYSVMVGKLVGPTGRVYAVEPHPDNFELLRANISQNSLDNIVIPYECAISDSTGVVPLYIAKHSNWHTLCAHDFVREQRWKRNYKQTKSVSSMSLLDFLADKNRVDFIRMDLEGFEVVILEEICRLVEANRFRGSILLETHPEFYDSSYNDLHSVLERLFSLGAYYPKFVVSDGHKNNKTKEFFRAKGYGDESIVHSFPICDRAIYQNISSADISELACSSEEIHALLLAPRSYGS